MNCIALYKHAPTFRTNSQKREKRQRNAQRIKSKRRGGGENVYSKRKGKGKKTENRRGQGRVGRGGEQQVVAAVRKGLRVPAVADKHSKYIRHTNKSTLEERNCSETGFRDPHLR